MNDMDGLSFEAAYAELERIIAQLDTGDLPLEDSVTLYERGKQLSEYCQRLLDHAELRITQINES
jgi:exodeoxyribonuclease VII small subunit